MELQTLGQKHFKNVSKSFWGIGTVFGNGNGYFTTTGVIILLCLDRDSNVQFGLTKLGLAKT